MSHEMSGHLRFASIRPLVRYVDDEQAVIEVHFTVHPPLPRDGEATPMRAQASADVFIEFLGPDSFIDEHRQRVALNRWEGHVRTKLVHPRRWWPAGMGEQALYRLSVSLMAGDRALDRRIITMGMTSVRRPGKAVIAPATRAASPLLVNGRPCDLRQVVAVDELHERMLLPVGGDMLLLIRGHYGPDSLYDAADRVGLLMIQCVPIHPTGDPGADMAAQVERLAIHPSLAGWAVGHLGQEASRTASLLRHLDPARSVFFDVPGRAA